MTKPGARSSWPGPGDAAVFQGGTRAVRAGFAAWAAGTALLAVGAASDRRQAFFSYLTAFAFAVSIATGALIFLMICHAMRATWPTAIRRIVEAIVSVLPVLSVLFIPLCFGLDALYPWLRPASISDARERALVVHKLPYLNPPFFIGRAALFFAIWLAAGALLRRWSLDQDQGGRLDVSAKLYRTSAALLPAVALALSFAAFDWLMSLSPAWSSSMFPVYYFASGFLSAIALVTAATYTASSRGLLPHISASHYYALGRLLLAFLIFWGYAAFFQFLLIWIANRPDEAVFYLTRARPPWGAVTTFLVVGGFAVPFLVLLSYRLKRDGRAIAIVSVSILLFQYVDIHWLVIPSAPARRFPFHWLDLAALLAVGGLATSTALLGLRGRLLLPIHDPKLRDAITYESS